MKIVEALRKRIAMQDLTHRVYKTHERTRTSSPISRLTIIAEAPRNGEKNRGAHWTKKVLIMNEDSGISVIHGITTILHVGNLESIK